MIKTHKQIFLEKLKDKYFFVRNLKYIEINEGWFDIVEELCENILLADPLESFCVSQIKEKFGGLRFYVNSPTSEEIKNLIRYTENKSFFVCELCASNNGSKIIMEGWIRTLCKCCENEIKKQI